MIVCPYNESFLVLVLQTDHSRIARLLAAHWGNDKFASLNPYLDGARRPRARQRLVGLGDQAYS